MRTQLLALSLLTMAACGGGSAAPQPDGPVSLGVIAGNNQVVPAAPSARLPENVVAQVVQLPSGRVGLRVLDQVTDAVLPPKAFAQTAVNGIPNQVVCASAPATGRAMRAEVACANTDALGKAYFVFLTDSIAGPTRANIAAALPTGTKVTDSVSATVMPGTTATVRVQQRQRVALSSQLALRTVILHAVDAYGNATTPAIAARVPSGWVVSGETVSAPATEGEAVLSLTLDRLAIADTVVSLRDITLSQWKIEGGCQYRANYVSDARGVYLDSTSFVGLTDSVTYAVPATAAGPTFYLSGTNTQFAKDGVVTAYPLKRAFVLGRQVPDALRLGVVNGSSNIDFTRTPATPNRYAGAGLGYCLTTVEQGWAIFTAQ